MARFWDKLIEAVTGFEFVAKEEVSGNDGKKNQDKETPKKETDKSN